MKKLLISLILAVVALSAYADSISYKTIVNVPYLETPGDDYQNERCKLDIYFPEGLTDFPTVVFFHGGGLLCNKRSQQSEKFRIKIILTTVAPEKNNHYFCLIIL